jgi:hypothetical protein
MKFASSALVILLAANANGFLTPADLTSSFRRTLSVVSDAKDVPSMAQTYVL